MGIYENPMYKYGNFSAFFLLSTLGKYEKKSCRNKLKFWEASWNLKRSICWKFQLSISLGRQKSPSTIQPGAKLNKPFCKISALFLPTYSTYGQKKGGDFAKFCDLLRIYELYNAYVPIVKGRKNESFSFLFEGWCIILN